MPHRSLVFITPDLDLTARNSSVEKIDKHHCALLVIDMQEYFRSIATPILPNVARLVKWCRDQRIPVIFTRHAHQDPAQDGGMLARWWEDLIIDGTKDAQILSEVLPLRGEKIVPKKRYSAFFNTDLHHHLQAHNIRQLMIAGVMTNLCCETTARDAFMHDYEVYFLSDGTATSHLQYHEATLLNLGYGFAHIVTCQEIMHAIISSEQST